MYPPAIKRVVFTEEEIAAKVAELGARLSDDYRGLNPIVIGLMKSTLHFTADLTRKMDIPLQIDVLSIGIYPGTTLKTGVVRIVKDLDFDITGRHVVMLEDVIRTGLTVGYLMQNMEARKPASVKICTLLNNPAERLVNIPVAYSGFEVPDILLAGYGMDYRGYCRNLPYIVEIDESVQV